LPIISSLVSVSGIPVRTGGMMGVLVPPPPVIVNTSTIYNQSGGTQGSDILPGKAIVGVKWNGTGTTGSIQTLTFNIYKQNAVIDGDVYAGVWNSSGTLRRKSNVLTATDLSASPSDVDFTLTACVIPDDDDVIGVHYDGTDWIATVGSRTGAPPTTDIDGLFYWNGTAWADYSGTDDGFMKAKFDKTDGAECS